MDSYWEAPVPTGPLRATVILPGSKSQTSRALVIGTIAESPTVVRGALASRDSYLAAMAMAHFGAGFDFEAERNEVLITPPKQLRGWGTIDCGLAGTVMRFAPALAAFANGTTRFVGDVAAEKRPLAPLTDALKTIGAKVRFQGAKGHLPLKVRGIYTESEYPDQDPWDEPLKNVEVDTTSSSQYLSALLLASPLFGRPALLRAEGRLPSWPYVAMSLEMLAEQGVEIVSKSSSSWLTSPTRPKGVPIDIEPDLSNAGPFLAAALLTGGSVTISGWPRRTDQVGKYWLELLPRFGATLAFSSAGLTVSAPTGLTWPGMEFDLAPCGELAPTVAALCLFASSPSTILGVGHLRGHETDRLEALACEIRKLGGKARVLRDGLRITPGQYHPADLASYDDHRMATFGAIVGLRVPGCRVNNIGTTAKTLPHFPARWDAMLQGWPSPEPLWLSEVHEDPSRLTDPEHGEATR